MKKLISLILCVCMLASMAVIPALAEAGTYTGVGTGKNGEGSIEVAVTIDENGTITAVEVTKNGDDAGLSDPAVAMIPDRIVASDNLLVDTVAGATFTSEGIIDAVANALDAAGIDPISKMTIDDEVAMKELAEVEASTDVLVIGAGIGGLTSALAARQAGANVTVIDKMAMPGGTTNVAGGILVCVESELFAGNRLESDTFEAVHAYWEQKMAHSGVESGYPDWNRLDGVLVETGKTVDWLVASGIEFSSDPFPLSASYPMALANGGGAGLIQMLWAKCQELGVVTMLNTEAYMLVTDEDGNVTGACAMTDTEDITFTAKNVILATGGISQNQDLVEKYSPKLTRAGLIPTSSVSHTGDGFMMALSVGAGTFDVFATPLYTTTVDPDLAAITDTSALSMYTQLGVNANGVRFGNEAVGAGWDTMDYGASDMIQDGNAPFWYVYDSSNEAVVAALEAGVESGIVAKGNDAAELALGMHVYTAAFTKTMETYNAAAAAGVDEEFGKAAAFMAPLTQAPFYAVKWYPTTFGSAGGVTTTEQGRVTRQDGTVINGLFAVGEMSNRYFYNENYVLAASLAMYSTMGHRAGTAAAEEALAK